MADIISLLPENISNQIAAGEVVQRPSSVVKELLENAIDAKSTQIKLIIKDAGKTSIQVIDNGTGMSETDARMCFERHATSKIKQSDDLFRIQTKGFRGEALAAIASVAQIELLTKSDESTIATRLQIEGGKFILQEPASHSKGSHFTVKNIFFNVPARRNFLKEDGTELKHILNEFERLAIAHQEISFHYHSNNHELYSLPATSLIKRIAGLFGNHLTEKLIYLEENTSYLKIKGYIGKPESAKKRRGMQYFFVNNRFVKSAYLHHAVQNAFDGLISPTETPIYFLFLELAPETIDINIHPTKTEIKFEDEKTIYLMLQTATKRALGKNNLSPSIDFDTEQLLDIDYRSNKAVKSPEISFDPKYNPFHSTAESDEKFTQNWQTRYENYQNQNLEFETETEQKDLFENKTENREFKCFQIHKKFIVAESNHGLLIVDQHRAHERILFEHYFSLYNSENGSCQQELFPNTLELGQADIQLIHELIPDLKKMGFDIALLSKNEVVIHGLPAELSGLNSAEIIEGILENYKINNLEIKLEKQDNLARSIAKNTCIKRGKELSEEEMKLLLNHLFNCEISNYSPSGKIIWKEFELSEIDNFLKNK